MTLTKLFNDVKKTSYLMIKKIKKRIGLLIGIH